jgi:hypothetical protein
MIRRVSAAVFFGAGTAARLAMPAIVSRYLVVLLVGATAVKSAMSALSPFRRDVPTTTVSPTSIVKLVSMIARRSVGTSARRESSSFRDATL